MAIYYHYACTDQPLSSLCRRVRALKFKLLGLWVIGPLNVKFLLGNLQHYCVLIGPAAERLDLDVNNLSVLINPSREKITLNRPKDNHFLLELSIIIRC